MGAEIVTTVTTAISNFATGVASTVVSVFDTVFTSSDGKLSNLAIWGLVMGAIGLGYALIRKFSNKAG